MSGDRAQVFTLEAFLAALVVLAGLLFALQAVVVTPATSGASQAPADAGQINSILSQAAESGSLRRAVLDWVGDTNGFVGTPAGQTFFTGEFDPKNNFHRSLQASFDPTVAFNVVVYYRTGSGGTGSQRMIYNGSPGDGAVRASTVVTLYDRDVSDPGSYFASDVSTKTDLYNVIEVEVVAWRA